MKQGWGLKQLGETCEIYQPKTISQKEMISDGKYPVFGANGIIGRYDKFNHEESELLITCRGATCGSVNVSLPKSWINGNAMVVRPKIEGLNRDYLEYLFRGGIDISKVITGSAQPQITRQSLSPVQIPIPPLDEQKRIVAKLDQCFAAIDKARANVKRNLQNAKDLFQSQLNQIFSQKGDDWVEKKLGEVCTLQRGFDLPTRLRTKGKFPLVSSSGISDSNIKYKVKAPGVTTGRSGSIGKVFYIENDFWPLNTVLYVKDFHNNYERFVYYMLIYFDLGKFASGTGVPTLNRNFVHCEKVNVPVSISEQEKIANQLDELSEEIENIEYHYQQELDALNELKKSILQKAFNGELV